ncbi:pyridoxamine 5'-phosphate oxidase family protein [bacterium]|nr:pyridoxamine 5'-phosphate oxidase family protein [candidate division CSSED10-310 bacterium]
MNSYHVRRTEKEITEHALLVELLRTGRWLTLALSTGNRPYAVAINYGYDADRNCLYMHCAENGRKMDMIRTNTACCASIVQDLGYKNGKCDHGFRSLIIHGTVTEVLDYEEIRHGLTVLIRHLEPDPEPLLTRLIPNPDSAAGVTILRLDIRHVTGKENS